MAETCFVCGEAIYEDEGLVLVLGRIYRAHCSESCLQRSVRRQRAARAVTRRRWLLRGLAVSIVLLGANTLWRRHRAPPPEWISSGPGEQAPVKAVVLPGPTPIGPAWPPTDEDWIFAFNRVRWTYPLPGPVRRAPIVDNRIFGPQSPKDPPPICRKEGRCGVDLGGDLWGEHVYAALDGVVDRVQASEGDDHGGQYVRLSHFGGMAFTQYFHLAAIPKGVSRGAAIKAGEIIGLVGDTGLKDGRGHLHFALSVRPSSRFSEVYWDPKAWMMEWPMRVPPHGTVAGFAPAPIKRTEPSRRRRAK